MSDLWMVKSLLFFIIYKDRGDGQIVSPPEGVILKCYKRLNEFRAVFLSYQMLVLQIVVCAAGKSCPEWGRYLFW